MVVFLRAPPACDGAITWDTGATAGSGDFALTGDRADGTGRGGDVEGPASGSLSFSESEESKSDDEPFGCVERTFGFQSV